MMRDHRFGEPIAPSLVPRTLQLLHEATQGVPEVLTEGALSYDLPGDRTTIYSNGNAKYAIYPDGKRERILIGNFIESVMVLQHLA